MDILTISIDEYTVNIYGSAFETSRIFKEAKHRGTPLGGTYSMRQDSPHSTKGQNHIHVYCKNNQLFAINKDGSAHDQSHGVRIPNKVARKLRVQLPDYKIPGNNIIESAPPEIAELLFNTQNNNSTGLKTSRTAWFTSNYKVYYLLQKLIFDQGDTVELQKFKNKLDLLQDLEGSAVQKERVLKLMISHKIIETISLNERLYVKLCSDIESLGFEEILL